MHCRRIRKSLIEYVEGGLEESARGGVARHLTSCDRCAQIAEKLSLSASALSTLAPLRMPDEVSGHVLARIESDSGSPSGSGLLRSPHALATAGLVAAALVGLAIVIGITVPGGPAKKTTVSPKAQQTVATGVTGQQAESTQPRDAALPAAAIPLPVAKMTGNNYNADTIKSMAEGLDVKRQFAERYSLDDAINLRIDYIRKISDEFVTAGGDGPMLEAMISYIEQTEPVMLPCYAEQAQFSGRAVIVIGLCGPPRNGSTKQLTRCEFWALDPGTFPTNPDASMVWWGQSIKQ